MWKFWKAELKFLFWYHASRTLFMVARRTNTLGINTSYKHRRIRKAIYAISDRCFSGAFASLRKGAGLPLGNFREKQTAFREARKGANLHV